MPSWKIHLIFDLIFVAVFLGLIFSLGLINNLITIFFLVLLNLTAALFPDIDTPKSRIRAYVSLILASAVTGFLAVNFSVDSVISGVIGFALIYLAIRFFPTEHRGATHTLWFSFIFSFALTFVFWLIFRFPGFEFCLYYLIILWGYLSHIILDKIT
ncbi:MAG: hypothetical protein COY38_00750 [Candidatus Aenigmarchaeota archaeon CG_4_10_14_0_8_um_filter_37_24]|nr:hypothetical protein [Candidatus Aenigmarchaeota archaeon]PIV69057.1 MAG: hypothetical protein COS07_02015 [Candidatus Aenigmarchaeota archaeon CG01_land_8_20_14_3_00_37_9]PIW41337.1 MAG: hypothetical protein COW21_02405 [Candidatus Aenigmarchaeota archaeon CG15_BIG_FIL_POST_REV_8_21_14_020_37_27]PIX50691.1 MAG: hypothetical protein COZ52_02790 [Candidatus Aenigmarchaeota archaeon CG_4_8_14_3_um_filter_37_24]PIY36091.1 MAG: hypothetical protein COZ04_01410 [Candidatus Aenigmarchaeota archaeo